MLRGDDDLRIVVEYVFANPVNAGLVEEPGEYGLSGGALYGADGSAALSAVPTVHRDVWWTVVVALDELGPLWGTGRLR